MASKWKTLRTILGMNGCYAAPKTLEDSQSDAELTGVPPSSSLIRRIELNPVSAAMSTSSDVVATSGMQRRTGNSTSSKKICAICLARMRNRDGQAVFTAECAHSFHFHCIASNVKHGNQICPICRAKWKEIPVRKPPSSSTLSLSSSNRRFNPSAAPGVRPPSVFPERLVFDDDERLDNPVDSQGGSVPNPRVRFRTVDVKAYPELSTAPRWKSFPEFTVLVNLKAGSATSTHEEQEGEVPAVRRRAPVDLVAVLDMSGSMAGRKLALLKRAMVFVIQNLSSSDRLSIVAFSSSARRILPLCRMTVSGKEKTLQAVGSLVAGGGTNIADGLKKAVRILDDRREYNVIASVILLSDGQDIGNGGRSAGRTTNYHYLLPSISGSGSRIPFHTFGFGTDHDVLLMHSISQISGGTFSFIETEETVQDAFAQCIGGLLSVVVHSLQLQVQCLHPDIRLESLKVGSYRNRLSDDRRSGSIDVGDVYADEERKFLVSLDVPSSTAAGHRTSLLRTTCVFQDPVTLEFIQVQSEEVSIRRTEEEEEEASSSSPEVDRERNRVRASEAMEEARAAAEHGDFTGAVAVLGSCRTAISQSKSQDPASKSLDAELKEMQERMVNRQTFEASGRAYVLSSLSSHTWQRATARGDTADGMARSFQTPSMTEMLSRARRC